MKVIFIFLLVFLAFGHDLWVERESKTLILRYGHLMPKRGEESLIKYDPDKVVVSECFNNAGEKVEAKISRSYPFRVEGECAVLYVVFSSGYWTKNADGTKNLPKDKVPGAIESWLSYESLKSIQRWAPTFSKPLTDDLEIVPLEDPFSSPVGKKVSFMVLYKRKPMKDMTVLHNGKVVGLTDEEGKIRLKPKEGINIISTTLKEKGDGVKNDYILKTASLQFEVR
jgi:Nickel uptake substrate-specific transmembrane region.